MSYLIGIYLESGFSWLIGWGVENTDKKLKNEEKEKHIIQKKSVNIFVFTFYIKA